MEPIRIVLACITGAAALLLAVYASFTARQKGPILSNTYLFLSPEERSKADKRGEYRLVTVIFGGLAVFFALLTAHIVTQWVLPYIFQWIVLAFVLVYAIRDAVKTGRGRK